MPSYIHLTPPNTCGLITFEGGFSYVKGQPSTKIWPPAGYTSFEQFETPEQAAIRARELDPAYNVNRILGSLNLTVINKSEQSVFASVGDTVTLECESSCSDPEAEIAYQWLKNEEYIPEETSSALNFAEIEEGDFASYTCKCSASNSKGQTGQLAVPFTIQQR